ncbi:MAG: HAD family phosphatase [Planctomycetia bacterium]
MKAVIFDMDGVLVDSYEAHLESWLVMARENGQSFTREHFDTVFGRTSFEIIAELWENCSFTQDEMLEMDDRKELIFRKILEKDFPAMPGIKKLIPSLAEAGFRLAVGSSGPPENVEFVLNELGLKDHFDAVVTGRDVTRGKPDPEVFLTAAKKLSVDPSRCVVVEDAPPGISAAHAGGMQCIGLASTGRTPEMLSEAEKVVESLETLTPAVFDELLDQS